MSSRATGGCCKSGGLLVGSVINEYQKDFSQGDFLIRNPIGFDPNSGAMAINDLIRTGQTVQFHVRDEDSAARDLDEMLSPTEEAETARGALLFTCNGRGTRLFKDRNHDARALHAACGGVPTAGFFAAGGDRPRRAAQLYPWSHREHWAIPAERGKHR